MNIRWTYDMCVSVSELVSYERVIVAKEAKAPSEETLWLKRSILFFTVAASDPKLAVVSVDRGRVKVECEARCWLPPPLMMILDDEGNSLTNEKPEQHKTTGGCYNMKQTAILQSPISRVICRVHQQTIKQSKTAEILIPAHWMESKANST
ncbi:hypothetical protein ILYODFUR_037687, partial [Ilyodon furcidens]